MGSELLSEPERLRDYLADMLAGKSDIAGARVLTRRTGDLVNQIETSLAKDGLLVLVMIPGLKPTRHQSATLCIDPASLIVRVVENPIINRRKTGLSALYVATRVAAHLQLHTPPFPWCGEIEVDDFRELNIISNDPSNDDESDYVGWDVLAHTRLSLQPRSTTN